MAIVTSRWRKYAGMGGAVELYLMRHGLAAPGAGMSDRERPLTPVGVREMECAAAGLASAGIRFDRIVSSPLVRAVQTARLVARAQSPAIEPEMLHELAGD